MTEHLLAVLVEEHLHRDGFNSITGRQDLFLLNVDK